MTDSVHVGVRADVLSGGAPAEHTVGTFNALYPNVSYSTEATIEAPANLVQVGAVARVDPAAALSLQYTVEGLRRYTSRDAFMRLRCIRWCFPIDRATASPASSSSCGGRTRSTGS